MQGNFTEFYVAHKLELRKGLSADGGFLLCRYAVWQRYKYPRQFIHNSTA